MEKKKIALLLVLSLALVAVVGVFYLPKYTTQELTTPEPTNQTVSSRNVINVTALPSPVLTGNVSVEEAIGNRRSVRRFSGESIDLTGISQILWAAQGITNNQSDLRAAPSAGKVYPLEIYVVTGPGSIPGLQEGVYHYRVADHSLEMVLKGDLRGDLAGIATGQQYVQQAPLDIVITGNYQKMINRYKDPELCTRFVDLEAGHVGENIYLQSEALGMVTVAIGSFDEAQFVQLLHLPSNEKPIYIYPVGHPQ